MPVLFPDSSRKLVNGSQRRRALSSTSAGAPGSHRVENMTFLCSLLLDFLALCYLFMPVFLSLIIRLIHILIITLSPWFYLVRLVHSLMSQQQSQHNRWGCTPRLWITAWIAMLSLAESSSGVPTTLFVLMGSALWAEQISMLYRGEVSSGSLQNIFDACSVLLLLYALKLPFWEGSKDEGQCPKRAQLISVSDVLLCPLVCMRAWATTLYLVSSNCNDSALKSWIYNPSL